LSIVSHFEPICGKPCWEVKQGHGSFLTLEFGTPKLFVGEVRERPRKRRLVKIWKSVSPRQVFVHGEWHLWIYCCEWKLTLGLGRLANVHSESSKRQIAAALRILNGQDLTKVSINPKAGSSIFEFDLGGKLTTKRKKDLNTVGEPYENWMLFEPSGHVLTYRADGKYSWHRADEPFENPEWLSDDVGAG
jgi:hypothetical protein